MQPHRVASMLYVCTSHVYKVKIQSALHMQDVWRWKKKAGQPEQKYCKMLCLYDFSSWWSGRALRSSWRRSPLCFKPGVPPHSPSWCPVCQTSSVGTQREGAPGSCPSTGTRTTTTRCFWGSTAPRAGTMSMTTLLVSVQPLKSQLNSVFVLLYTNAVYSVYCRYNMIYRILFFNYYKGN